MQSSIAIAPPSALARDGSYEVAIIGAGVTGAALLFVLSRHTDVQRIAIVEQYRSIATVNSKSTANSQTLHFGDIETNYGPAAAARVRTAATMVKRYLEEIAPASAEIHEKYSKMVLGAGAHEVEALRARREALAGAFPELRLLDRDEIAAIEPKVVEGRGDLHLAALHSTDGYAVDFGRLSESFVKQARKTDKSIDEFFGTRVRGISERAGLFRIATSEGEIVARTVVAAAGAHSLLFAKALGYGRHFAILPVAGSFWTTPKKLNGKVYTIQDPKLPFAAIHGDPDTNDPSITRFGPTAKPVPLLERGKWSTFFDFVRVSNPRFGLARAVLGMLSDRTIRGFVTRNFLFDLPIAGRRAFLADVRKIVPTVSLRELTPAHGVGGIRPQLVDTQTRTFQMGEAKIVGDRILFDVTPSPGASVCLKNAESDALKLCAFLGRSFDATTLARELS